MEHKLITFCLPKYFGFPSFAVKLAPLEWPRVANSTRITRRKVIPKLLGRMVANIFGEISSLKNLGDENLYVFS